MIGQKKILILQRFTSTSDGMGGSTEKWSSRRKIRGVFETSRGNERFMGESRTLVATHKFYIDFQKGIVISEKDRFVLGERIFDIVLVDNVAEQDRFLEIYLEETA